MDRQVADPSIAAVITVTEMYHELQRVGAAVSRMDDKLSNIPDKFRDNEEKLIDHESRIRSLESPEKLVDHEKRIRLLEARMWRASGAAALIGLLSSGVVAALLHH